MRDKSNPFDRLFRLGGGPTWTRDDIEQFMEDMQNDFFHHDPDIDKYDGYRREEINGEVTEYVLDDGEWKELPLDENDETLDLEETSDGYRLTLDVSQHLPFGNFESSASINNGVLEVSFERVEE